MLNAFRFTSSFRIGARKEKPRYFYVYRYFYCEIFLCKDASDRFDDDLQFLLHESIREELQRRGRIFRVLECYSGRSRHCSGLLRLSVLLVVSS